VRRGDHLYRGVVWMGVSFECYVLSGRGPCFGQITCTEVSYGCLSDVTVVCCQLQVCATS